MSNVLERIVADKRKEINQRKIDLPLSRFIDTLMPSRRSFYDALKNPNAGYIFECKKASPSKGLIRAQFDLDEIIQAYAPQAACISVLTDEKYFQGKFEYLEYVSSNVTQPVLNKDFFIDPYQVYLACHHHADAILLMLSVLDDDTYRQLADLADKFDLDVLTEVSNEEEVHRAIALDANIIGINNRDLRDLSTNLATTEHLVPLIKQSDHPCLIISESGIYSNQDVRRLAPLVDGFLVGSSIMSQPDLSVAVAGLVYGQIKVCGITTLQDAQLVKQAGASYAGLIFAEKSKRYITEDQALSIVAGAAFNYIGVFVDSSADHVADLAKKLNLFAVQLHGHEDQQYVQALRQQLPASCKIIKAFGITDTLPDFHWQHVDYYLLDCKVGDQSGGTGQQFDWHLLDNIKDKSKLILAGGISPANVALAISTGVRVLDLNSGVESAPGTKDPDKVAQAFEALRQY